MRHLRPAITAALIFTASAATAEPITLRVTHGFPAREGEFRREIAQQFMQKHPDVKIVLEATTPDCGALLQQLMRAAITNDLPDVSTPCYQEVGILSKRDILVPLDQFIAQDKTWKDVGIEPGALATTQWGGKTLALPESVSTSIVYYNMDIIRKARGDLKTLPQSWTDILALAKDIKAKAPDVTSLYYEYYPDNFNWSFNGLVYSHGGNVFTPEGRIAFNGDAGMAALRLMRQFGEAGMVEMTAEQARQSFASGKIGIMVGSNSRLAQLTANGDQFEIRTAPFPQSAPDGKMQSGGGGIAILTKDPAKQKAAWEYIKFAAGPAAQTLMTTKTGLTPVNTKAVYSPEFLGNFYKDKPNYLTAIQQLPRIKSMNDYPGENARKISVVIRDHLQTVVTLKRTPDEVMPDMVHDVEALLPK